MAEIFDIPHTVTNALKGVVDTTVQNVRALPTAGIAEK